MPTPHTPTHLARTLFLLALPTLALSTAALAQPKPTAFTHAHVIPISGPELTNATVIIHNGKITAVGPTDSTPIPADATTIDCTNKFIMPGLVDTHNHIGGVAGADGSATIQPAVRVSDSINPLDSGFRRAVAGGLTTLNIMPGSGHLMSGQTVYVKLRPAKTIDEMTLRSPSGAPLGGMKMANGTNPMRDPPFAGTRGKAAAMVREQFIKAQDYKRKRDAASTNPAAEFTRDLAMEALCEVLDGTRTVHHHTHRTDDIMTVLRLKKEFGFKVVLHHVSEAWKIADEIAKADVPCSAILVDSPGGKLEAAELNYECGAILERAGVKVAFHTDDWITDSRLFLRMAALAVRAGMTREGALKALTIVPANMMDLGDRVGTLEPNKDADIIVLSGDPFSVYTKVEQTFVEGTKVFDRAIPEDRLHADGGFGAGRDQAPYFCCYDDANFIFGRNGTQWQSGGN